MNPRPREARDDPVPIAESLARVGAELGLAPADVVAAIRDRWEEIVGSALAPHATARSLREGVLRVVVDDAIWATRLRYLSSELLDRLDAVAGQGAVIQVRVTVMAKPGSKTR